MSELYIAYSEYLDRMYQESDDLAHVDLFSVPHHINLEKLQEWADVS
jgi:hypothetical protein